MADDELQAQFAPNGSALEADVVSELQSILRLHDLSAEDLYLKWDSYCLKLEMDANAVTLKGIRGLKQTIQDSLEKDNSRRAHQVKANATPRPGAAARGGGGGDVFGMLDGLVPSTPATGSKLRSGGGASGLKKKTETPKSALGSSPAARGMGDQLKAMNGTPAAPFSERNNPGEVVELLNDRLPTAEPPIAPFAEPRIRLKASSDQSKMAYKPLSMKLSESSEMLDDRIDEFLSIVQDHHDLEDSAFGSAASQSTTPVVAVGRIASDSMEGKLNAASLVLETSRRTGMGLRVPLNMEHVRAWSFFPGQIVALKGTNASGKAFVVEEILEIPFLPSAASTPAVLEAHRQRLHGDPDAMETDDSTHTPLTIIYTAGPYTADDNLDFEPLHALCSQAADTYADALIMTGPFLDADHPLLATGDFDLPDEAQVDPDTVTMTTVFKYLFSPALNRLAASNPSITIILVPSTRDLIDKHVSWPQDMMVRKDLGLPKVARLVSNPMAFQMNEVLTAVSSQDALFELRGEEVVQGGMPGEAMGRLCRYLIEQRHYFPLFPPADRKRLPKTGTEEGVATGAVLDVGYLKLGEMVSVRPDVMLTPSLLPPFAKVFDSVLAINPGPLSKRRGAGTYARMTLHPPTSLQPDDDSGMVSHKVFERARVEIVRI